LLLEFAQGILGQKGVNGASRIVVGLTFGGARTADGAVVFGGATVAADG